MNRPNVGFVVIVQSFDFLFGRSYISLCPTIRVRNVEGSLKIPN